MKKLLLLTFLALQVFASSAQNSDLYNKVAALQLIGENKQSVGLTDNELKDVTISSTYTVTGTGMTMVYLQQTYKGIPVLNSMKVLAFKEGKLVSNAGNLIDNLEKATAGYSEIPSIGADEALRLAFAEEKLTVPATTNPITSNKGRVINYGKPAGVSEEITAELLWFPVEKDKVISVRLGWQVQVAPAGSDDVWHIRIDAKTGKLIEKVNININEDFKSHQQTNNAGIIGSGTPKFWLNSGPGNNIGLSPRPSLVTTVNYNVIPFPFEAPSFTSAAIRTNPWTAAPGNATTLEWHNDGSLDYTISRGNNIWATEDTLGTNLNTGLPATSTTAPDPLNFVFTPNYNVEPSRNPTMQQFCITNVFYWSNIMHDLNYQYGFDEVAGNYQQTNFGRGGIGNDYVMALAQSGAAGHIGNNANFLPTVDGVKGRMRMYLFNAVSSVTLHVNTPAVLTGNYTAVEGAYSTNNLLANVGPVTGQVIYFNDDAGGTTHMACGTAANTLTGKIAMIDRGTCNFTVKVLTAQNAGAIAVIMVNNVPGAPIVMGGTDNTITIPSVMISQSDGALFAAQLSNNLNVTLSGTAGQVLDGDLDAGVICHEYTHGISNRLTGGPGTASCLNNAEQGGEGWSDYFALMMTTNWATATTGDGPNRRPIGTYVVGQTPAGAGIRNYPYSTDIAINPLTYADMGTGIIGTEVHNIGEIWCMAVWEMTWDIILQENNINTNFYNFSLANNGGNSIALKLVLEGMRLQPCSPGYIDARNAILTADMNLYAGRHQCSIWTAFAKRGMGYSASEGSSNSATDQTPAFNLPPAPTITTQPIDVTVNVGNNASFSVVATPPINGAYLVYNWQVSTDGGATFNDLVPAVMTPTLTLTAVTGAMNGNKYRCIIKQGCASTTSSVATLTVIVPSGFTFSNPAPAVATCPAPATMDIVLGTTAFGGFTNPITVSSSAAPAGTTVSFIPSNTVTPGNSVTVRLSGTNTLIAGNYVLTITGTASGATTQTRDITYTINAGTGPAITAQPTDQSLCAGSNTSFSITSATATTFQWQLSTDGGVTYNNVNNGGVYSGATTATLTITGAGAGLNNNRYRCIASTQCGSTTSSGAILTVNAAPAITSQPTSASVCTGANQTFTVGATGTSLTYQWYISTDGGATFNLLPNGGVYSGATTASLTITGVTAGLNNNQYRCVVTGICPPSPLTSNAATLTVAVAINISAQPTDVVICAGNNTSFTVTASGVGGYQWQLSTDGGVTYSNVLNGGVYSGATTATLNLTGVTAVLNANRYRCALTSGCGNVNSNSALLTVNSAPAITSQPASASVCTGSNQTFTVGTTGSSLTYQWYISTDGGATFNILPNGGVYSGATTASLTITGVTIGLNNNQYRCVVTGICPPSPLTTNAATLTVTTTLNITGQPVDATICAGSNTSFTVTAAGSANYQWQVSTDGGATYNNVVNGGIYSGATTATLSLTGVTAVFNGNRYRCNLTSTCGNATSVSVLLTVNTSPAITAQPANATVCTGTNNTFSVTVTGSGLTYQWQLSTSGCAGPWNNIVGATSSSYTLTAITVGQNNTGYRCIVTGVCAPAVTSNCGLLTVLTSVSITGQPANQTICEGSNTSFTVSASGSGLVYQWQVSTDGGTTFNNVVNGGVYSGATTTTLAITGGLASMNNYRYRAVVSNGTCVPGTSTAAILTVNTFPVITTAPASITICEGGAAVFTVAATTGVGSLSYQWQFSTDGGVTWINIAGATTTTFSETAIPVGQNGYRFRVVVTAGCGSVNSVAAILTVNPLPTFTLNNLPTTLCLSDPAITLSASIGGGVWSGTGVSGTTFTPSVAGLGTKTVTYTVTSLGCTTAISSTIQVNQCAERHRILTDPFAVFVYPNPNNGHFSLRMNTDLYSNLEVKVFASDGKLVRAQLVSGLSFGSVIPMDISRQALGTYHLYLFNSEHGAIHRGVSIILGTK